MEASRPITVMGDVVHVSNLEVPNRDVASYLLRTPETEWEAAFTRVLEVGVFCIERASASQDLDFVRIQVERLLSQVEEAVRAIPTETERELTSKLGTGDGQVLAPVRAMIEGTVGVLNGRIGEVRNLLASDIDPGKESSTLGAALKQLRDMLDPNRTDSVQGRLAAAIKDTTASEGALASAVKAVVSEAVKPLSTEVDRLAKEIRGREAAAEIMQETTLKGKTYEEEVVERLQRWASVTGAAVSHVGGDNQVGDVLITFPQAAIPKVTGSIVVEVRDLQSPRGRKPISDDVASAIAARKANSAIYLSRSTAGLAKEIGEWAEGECQGGPYIATVDEHLMTAVRFLIVQLQLRATRAYRPEIDPAAMVAQIESIRTALKHVATINRRVSDVQRGASDIQSEAEALRSEIQNALSEIEAALQRVKIKGEDEAVA